MPPLVERAADVFREVVILPSSFDIIVPAVRSVLLRPNVKALTRDRQSARSMQSIISTFGSGADCALYFAGFEELAAVAPTKDLQLFLRTDAGSPLAALGLIPDPRRNVDISTTAASLDDFLRAICEAQHTITDRLPVAVAAVMLGRHLTFVDPYFQKISSYFELVLGRPLRSKEAMHASPAWLVEQGLEMSRGSFGNLV